MVGAIATGPTGADDATIAGLLETITGGGASVEAANHGHPLDGKPWSVIITYRGSEDSQRVKDAWLAEALRGHLGAGKELGQAGSVHAWWGAQARARAPTQQRQGKGWTTAVAQA